MYFTHLGSSSSACCIRIEIMHESRLGVLAFDFLIDIITTDTTMFMTSPNLSSSYHVRRLELEFQVAEVRKRYIYIYTYVPPT